MLASALLALALVAGAQGPAAPAAPRRFDVDALLALPRVEAPALSPDGSRVAFTVARPAPGGERLESALYLVAASGGAPRRLTRGEERVSSPAFSPDGGRLAFLSTRGGSTQAWVLDLAGGEAARATSLPGGADAVLWTPDGRSLLVTSDVDPRCGADAACNEQADAAAKGRPRVATRLLFRHWTSWRERVRTHVLRVPLEGGAPVVDLTPGDRDAPPFERGGAGDLAVSPDGRTLYFVAVSDPVEAISTNADVYAVPLAGGDPRRLTSGAGWDGSPRPSPDGERLAWLSQPRAGFEADRFHVMVAAADGSGARDLTASADLSAHDLHWARGGKALRFTAVAAGSTVLYEVDAASGRIEPLTPGADRGRASALSYSADGSRVAALLDGMTEPPEVGILGQQVKDPRRHSFRPLTSFARDALAGVPRPEVRPLAATSPDGTKVHGWLVLPPGRGARERLPAVVLVHGGPQGAWDDAWTWRWNAMAYAARGWAVVLPNPRGSTGYGQAYVDAISGHWGAAYDDVMAVLDAAIAAGDVDGGRTCAAGASYGGFMVNYVNGQTDRFRCLVVHAGLYDLAHAWATTDELWFPEWDLGGGGPPWERRDAYERFSPDRFVARWKTPTLVSHGELDDRCTVDQGYAAFTALQRRGIPSKLLVFPDEGHWVLRPKNAKVFYDVVFGWISDHLGTAADATSKAP